MATMNVKIEGLDKLLAAYKRSPQIVAETFKDAIQRALFGIEAAAKPITPIDTGFLRNSMATSLFTEAIGGQIVDTAPYASYVHDGTESWPLSSPPKNSNTVRQFFLEAVKMTEVDREKLWEMAGDKIAQKLAT